MNWDDLRYLVAIIESKTASTAAKKLNVNYVTVCRRIERLENSLKQKLIYYKDNKYYPTNEGAALYRKALEIHTSLQHIEEDIVIGNHLKQTITISSSASISENILISGLSNLLLKYSQIKVNYLLSTNLESVQKKECDIAIRFINYQDNYNGEIISTINYNLCCSNQYYKKNNS